MVSLICNLKIGEVIDCLQPTKLILEQLTITSAGMAVHVFVTMPVGVILAIGSEVKCTLGRCCTAGIVA